MDHTDRNKLSAAVSGAAALAMTVGAFSAPVSRTRTGSGTSRLTQHSNPTQTPRSVEAPRPTTATRR
jgi:hypothetical protein